MTDFSDDQNSPTPDTASEMPVILLVDDNAINALESKNRPFRQGD
jgi:hypothetical protein